MCFLLYVCVMVVEQGSLSATGYQQLVEREYQEGRITLLHWTDVKRKENQARVFWSISQIIETDYLISN